jgi:hypothetical protein
MEGIHLTAMEGLENREREREPRRLQNRPKHRGSLQPTLVKPTISKLDPLVM